jgi:hypothetical protein
MPSVKDKIAAHLREVESIVLPGGERMGERICAQEVDSLREAAKDYDRAERSRRAEVQNAVTAMIASGAAATVSLACLLSKQTPAGRFICFFGGLTGIGTGASSFDTAVDEIWLAEEEREEAERELEDALDALCRCIKNHLQDLTLP